MENAYFLDLAFDGRGAVFGGVYDGHGGDEAAVYASEHLHLFFLHHIRSNRPPGGAFVDAYLEVSRRLSDQDSGTTAVTFFITDGLIHAANTGDAQALLVGVRETVLLSVQHRVDDPLERERVRKAGAVISYPYVMSGLRGVMPTRALGDEYFRSVGVTSMPSVCEHAIEGSDLWLVAACDGLFDMMTNEEIAQIARLYHEPRDMVEALREEVMDRRGGWDNLTIIAVSLRP